MPQDTDFLDLLAADHHNLEEQVGAEGFVVAVMEHLAVERGLLYPLVERSLGSEKHNLAHLREIDRLLEIAAGATAGTADELRAHIAGQEPLFADLRAEVLPKELAELAEQVPLVMAEAPTHPHPRVPDHGPLHGIATDIAATVDQLRDKTHKHPDE